MQTIRFHTHPYEITVTASGNGVLHCIYCEVRELIDCECYSLVTEKLKIGYEKKGRT